MEKVKISTSFLKRKIAEGFVGKYADTDIQGFFVRIGEKSVTFYLKRRQDKKVIEIKIGRFPDMTVDEAKSHALDKIGAIANYKDINAPSSRKDPILRDALEYFIETQQSQANVKSIFKNLYHLENRRIRSIQPSEITEVFDSLSDKPHTANLLVRYLSSAIKKMEIAIGESLPNITSHIKKHPCKPRTRFMQPEEAPAVIRNLNALRNTATYGCQADALLLMIYTGQRKSRVLSITTKDIDMENRIWHVPGNNIKRPVDHPLNEFAWGIIESRIAITGGSGPLFIYKGKMLQDCRKTFWKACSMSGITGLHIHDLRRSLGSWMLSTGASIEEVSKVLGHSSISITEQVYAHLLSKRGRDVTHTAIAAMISGDLEH